MNFSDRIQKRLRLWWNEPAGFSDVRLHHLPGLIERLDQRMLPVMAHHSNSRWQRGLYWQRRLVHKLNGRQFALKHGCDVPKLYWQRHLITASVFSDLPGSYVIKPCRGTARQGVYVMHGSREPLSGRTLAAQDLYRDIRSSRGLFSANSLLAEEFVANETGGVALPVEYKVHVFCRTIGAVQVIHRNVEGRTSKHRFYNADWKPIEENLNTQQDLCDTEEPPRCLRQLLQDARTLGAAWGTYVRVDMYASKRGPLFGEFSSTPMGGNYFSEYADDYFGRLWDEECPNEV